MADSITRAVPAPPDVGAIKAFAERVGGVNVSEPVPLPGGGSSRRYYRMLSEKSAPWGDSIVGVITSHPAEARAFEGFTRHLLACGIPVPRHFGNDVQAGMYLVEDLGDFTLSDRLREWKALGAEGVGRASSALHSVVGLLARFQVRGGRGLDSRLCFDGAELAGPAFRADLQLFLTHYVPRFVLCPGPDAEVQRDLDGLIAKLDGLDRTHLCHRDFQARNIMWTAGGPVLLDYQGARFGPLAYDLASLLYSPDTGLTEPDRAPLMRTYLESLSREGSPQERASFLRDFHAVVLVRRLQALGAYARIAVQEGKPEYLEKIPPALATLRTLFQSGQLRLGLPNLEAWLLRALAPEGVAVQ